LTGHRSDEGRQQFHEFGHCVLIDWDSNTAPQFEQLQIVALEMKRMQML
jgi:hypothetical protein